MVWAWTGAAILILAVVTEAAPSWGAFLLVLVVLGMLLTAQRKGYLSQ